MNLGKSWWRFCCRGRCRIPRDEATVEARVSPLTENFVSQILRFVINKGVCGEGVKVNLWSVGLLT